MPLLTQRRNTAYLNSLMERHRGLDWPCDLSRWLARATSPIGYPGRQIDVWLRRLSAAEPKGLSLRRARSDKRDLCGLTIELSGAAAAV